MNAIMNRLIDYYSVGPTIVINIIDKTGRRK
jgi:hypothetical protein